MTSETESDKRQIIWADEVLDKIDNLTSVPVVCALASDIVGFDALPRTDKEPGVVSESDRRVI